MADARPYETCAFCPKLCRHVCPVAVGSGREAATPTAMMTGPWAFLSGYLPAADAARSAALCVSCGRCTEVCKLDRPVADLLAAARRFLGPPPTVAPPAEVEGGGEWVAVEPDERRWSAALARALGRPVGRLQDVDDLGAALLDYPDAFESHARALRNRLAGRTLVVVTAPAARAARAAGLDVRHLAELLVPPNASITHHPCRGPQIGSEPAVGSDWLGCCGAADPLARVHPAIADELGAACVRQLGTREVRSPDARCARHLARHGAVVSDPVDWLLAGAALSVAIRPLPRGDIP